MNDQQDELVRRIEYIVDYLSTLSGIAVESHHPFDWNVRTDITATERLLGWAALDINHEAHTVTLHVCPGLLAQVTVTLPWSPEPAEVGLVLDEAAIDDPDDQTVVVPVDEDTRRDAPCRARQCTAVHTLHPAALHYEAIDDPDPDGYWFFDNLVRVIALMAEAELLGFADDELSGVESTPARRRYQAWERLYAMHPAVHRFMATAMATGLDLAQAQEA